MPNLSKDALSVIIYRTNEVVWRVATDIYTKSGYQVDFVFVRDIINLRIEPLQNKIAEEERIKKANEAEKAKREAEEQRIRKEKEAEEARTRGKLEAERLAREIEQERIRKGQETKLEAERQEKIVEEKKIRKYWEIEDAKFLARKEESSRKIINKFRTEFKNLQPTNTNYNQQIQILVCKKNTKFLPRLNR